MQKRIELTSKQIALSTLLLACGIVVMGVVAGIVWVGFPIWLTVVLIVAILVCLLLGYVLAYIIMLRDKSRKLSTEPYEQVIAGAKEVITEATTTLDLYLETLEKAAPRPEWLVSNRKLRRLEGKAVRIVVITPDLEHDVGAFQKTVLENLKKKKKYCYVILDNPKNRDKWGAWQKSIEGEVGHLENVEHIWVNEQQQKLRIFEMVLYDPYDENSEYYSGFWTLPRKQNFENIKMDKDHFKDVRANINALWMEQKHKDLSRSLA